MKLKDLVEEYGANGFIYLDDGNGSVGEHFIYWDEMVTNKNGKEVPASRIFGNIRMFKHPKTAKAFKGSDPDKKITLLKIVKSVIKDYDSETLFASDWIEDDDRNYPYQATNPYRFRIIF